MKRLLDTRTPCFALRIMNRRIALTFITEFAVTDSSKSIATICK
jgi:hypothetical protein